MKRPVYMIIFLFLLMLMTGCAKPTTPIEEPEPTPKPVETPMPKPIATPIARYGDVPEGISPLTGLPYEGDGRAIMVQMENTLAARPHSGIAEADLIYEMEVESKITRLTAFFMSSYPIKAGPVRSARKQHIDLWDEWDFLYTFYGGSEYPGQNVYEIMEENNIQAPYLDGLKTSASFFRSKDRKSPHNAYTNTKVSLKNYDYEPQKRSLYYDENAIVGGTTANEIQFSYNSGNKIKYVYDSEIKEYKRYINENPMVDKESNEQVSVKNIILQHANHYKVEDTVYTNIDLVGNGKAEYFTNGIIRIGTWERKNQDSFTVYYDEKGAEIPFKPGRSYIQILRTDTKVSVKP